MEPQEGPQHVVGRRPVLVRCLDEPSRGHGAPPTQSKQPDSEIISYISFKQRLPHSNIMEWVWQWAPNEPELEDPGLRSVGALSQVQRFQKPGAPSSEVLEVQKCWKPGPPISEVSEMGFQNSEVSETGDHQAQKFQKFRKLGFRAQKFQSWQVKRRWHGHSFQKTWKWQRKVQKV